MRHRQEHVRKVRFERLRQVVGQMRAAHGLRDRVRKLRAGVGNDEVVPQVPPEVELRREA
jgi:hypothetical protein